MDITQISILIIDLIFAIVAVVIVPKIKGKFDLAAAEFWINHAVRAAEQLYNQNEGTLKKQYVLQFLWERGIKLNAQELEVAIEAEVLKLHNALKE